MDTTVAAGTEENVWGGGNEPLGASYGKLMMWFFLLSDALTFSGFLVSYGFARFKFIDSWPIADEVFTHIPFFHGEYPMYYVAFMTFVLIMSSVTMVLAVDAGHKMQQNKVTWYMFFTIIGGLIFLGSQAWEWSTFIKGESGGAIETNGGRILHFVDSSTGERIALGDFAKHSQDERIRLQRSEGLWFQSEGYLPEVSVKEVVDGFNASPNVVIRTETTDETGKSKVVLNRDESLKIIKEAKYVVEGANLVHNEYGHRLFADFFFFITGFHGFHVFTGVLINMIIFFNVVLGTYERRGHYEMVEKVGLYWHFVDLVWVFVFTFFYLV